MNKIELLAPAGNMECLVAAINNGADAIYLGGKDFSARAYADNFDDDQIIEAIKYAHLRNAKVYIGINITLFDDEIENVLDFVDKMYVNDVDALIVSDFGLINILRKRYSDLAIHVSTQFNAHNLWQVKLLEQLDVQRIILARETALSTVKYIKQNSKIDLEVFAHGALCVCYSGNCLHSSMIGKRSGNRGKCAQPCRMEYSLIENGKAISNKKYLLSMKDLNVLENIDKLIDSGVKSLKIEGRMKSKEYVSLVVKTYREAIDNYYLNNEVSISKEQIDELKQVYSRDFTKGFLFNENNANLTNTFYPAHLGDKIGQIVGFKNNHIQIKLFGDLKQKDKITILNTTFPEIKMYISKIFVNNKLVNQGHKGETIELNITSKINKDAYIYKSIDDELINSINDTYLKNVKRIPVSMKFMASVGDNMALALKDNHNHSVLVKSEYVVEKAINSPTSKEKIKEQLSKLNDSCYVLEDINIIYDETAIIPIKYLNELRRVAINKLNDLRANVYHRDIKNINDAKIELFKTKENVRKFKVKVNNQAQLDAIASLKGIDAIYYCDSKTYKTVKEKYPKLNIIPVLKRIMNDNRLDEDSKSYVINNYGDLIKHSDAKLICDLYMNITNSKTIASLLDYNIESITLSSELNRHQIKDIIDNFNNYYGFVPPLEMVVYGHYQTMIMKHCFIAKEHGFERKNCGACKGKTISLLDRYNYEFPVTTDEDCNVTIYNSKAVNLIDYVDEILANGISSIRLDFTIENKDEVYNITKAFLDKINTGYYDLDYYDFTFGYYLDNTKN